MLSTKKKRGGKGQSGPSARRILVAILGEFLLSGPHDVWNAVLVKAIVATGQTEQSARQAILRAAAAGWLKKRRDGRRVLWTLTPTLLTLLAEGWQHVYPVNRRAWDDRWLILYVSLPERHRTARDKLYKALHWAGFGNPSAGLWVSPYSEFRDEIKRVIRTLKLANLTFSFVGQALDIGINDQRLVQLCWDLDGISRHYRGLLKRFSRLKPQTEEQVFVAHVLLLVEWGKLPLVDPRLPNALLPSDWDGHPAAADLEQLLVQRRRVARRHWNELVERAKGGS
jgi:phenylacetic acid degradation operon negative regulatory protein